MSELKPMTLAEFKVLAQSELEWAVATGNSIRDMGASCPVPLARFLAFLPKAIDIQSPEAVTGAAESANAAAGSADRLAMQVKALVVVIDEVRAGLGAQAGEETIAAVHRVAASSAGVPTINVIRALVAAQEGEDTAAAVRRALSEATTAARSEAERALLGSAEALQAAAKTVAEGKPWQAPERPFVSALPIPGTSAAQTPLAGTGGAIKLVHGLILAQRGGGARCVFSEAREGAWDVQTITMSGDLGPTAGAHEGKWLSEFWEEEPGKYNCAAQPLAPHWSTAAAKPAAALAEVVGPEKAAALKADVAPRAQTVIPGTVPEMPPPPLSTWEPDGPMIQNSADALTKAAAAVGRPAVTADDVKRLIGEFKAEKGSAPMPPKPGTAFFHWAAKRVKS